jgi:hypothetical protein
MMSDAMMAGPMKRPSRPQTSNTPKKRRSTRYDKTAVSYAAGIAIAAFQDPTSYFHHISQLPSAEAVEIARNVWKRVNLPNPLENIQPTRARAHLVVHEGPSHFVDEVWLRQH